MTDKPNQAPAEIRDQLKSLAVNVGSLGAWDLNLVANEFAMIFGLSNNSQLPAYQAALDTIQGIGVKFTYHWRGQVLNKHQTRRVFEQQFIDDRKAVTQWAERVWNLLGELILAQRYVDQVFWEAEDLVDNGQPWMAEDVILESAHLLPPQMVEKLIADYCSQTDERMAAARAKVKELRAPKLVAVA